jgi:hypothetical protein
MTWTEDVSAVDDRFHPRTQDPWWNESSYITFQVPERKLAGFIYFYFRPNQNMAMAGPVLWDATSEDFSNCLYCGWDWHLPIPPSAEMFDFKLDNGFSVETLQPQKSYRHLYDAPGCQFDLVFTASREPYYMKGQDDGVNSGMTDFVKRVDEGATSGQYEQYGRMNGTLVIEGETIEVVDAATQKDHTWGPREIYASQQLTRVGYSGAMASDDSAFHVFSVNQQPYELDPIIGMTDQITSGFYVRDGVLGEIQSGTRRCTERGGDGRPLVEVIEATDHLGRALTAEGEMTNCLKWPGSLGPFMAYLCQQKWTFDGQTDAPGHLQDWFHSRQYRRLLAQTAGYGNTPGTGLKA